MAHISFINLELISRFIRYQISYIYADMENLGLKKSGPASGEDCRLIIY